MIYLGLLILVALLLLAPLVRNRLKLRRDTAWAHRTVHQDKSRYAFLIDRHFTVKDTNFYELNPALDDGQPPVLGNVLHCQTGCDSGLCGTGIACPTCPVRLILTNSFKQRRPFDSVAATMRLYDERRQAREVDVSVDGELVYLDHDPHFIVGVRQKKNETETT